MRNKVETVAKVRWGNGFERAVGYMQVFRLRTGEFVAHHRDTKTGRNAATRVSSLDALSGFFGFCPRAVSVYDALGIPVRRVA